MDVNWTFYNTCIQFEWISTMQRMRKWLHSQLIVSAPGVKLQGGNMFYVIDNKNTWTLRLLEKKLIYHNVPNHFAIFEVICSYDFWKLCTKLVKVRIIFYTNYKIACECKNIHQKLENLLFIICRHLLRIDL